MQRRDLLALAPAALLGSALPRGALAQDFPSRPIRWIVPYLAGTAPDNTVRIVAEAMSALLKQPVVVDNKGGVAGNLGAQLAAKTAPDGHTWVYSASPMATNMRMYRKPGFDALKDFIHVGRIAISDLLVVVHADAGITSLKDLMDRARKSPGKLTWGSGGIGSPAHMGGELLLHTAGADALHVPYKGASESANAVMGRQVDYALTISSVSMPHISGGKMLPLAVSGPQRNPRLPNVPTITEAGLPVTLVSFGGLSVPAGTPAPVVRRLAETLDAVLAQPEVRRRLEANGGIVAPASSEAYTDALRTEISQTEKMMKLARLEPQ